MLKTPRGSQFVKSRHQLAFLIELYLVTGLRVAGLPPLSSTAGIFLSWDKQYWPLLDIVCLLAVLKDTVCFLGGCSAVSADRGPFCHGVRGVSDTDRAQTKDFGRQFEADLLESEMGASP